MRTCKVLLMGGIGSGKSSVARMLSERGAEVIEADRIGHQVLEDHDVIRQIESEWPSTVSGGRVDRSRLASIVFSDPTDLRRLEAMTHPRIRSAVAEHVQASAARVIVVEMPLLEDFVEGEWLRVVVDASESCRIDRLIDRGLDEESARARMVAQPSDDEFRGAADVVIVNDGSWAELESQVEALYRRISSSSCHAEDEATAGEPWIPGSR